MSQMMIWGRYFLGIVMSSALALGENSAVAQITPDGTLPNNTNVKFDGKIWNITDGTRAGNNLFHSFKEFSVSPGQEAHFNNATDIQNIISRVTGSSRSEIDGLIKVVQGNANLFLINPHGIVFGPNASLSVGGSFVASTANSLKFADGTEFSATNPQTTPLLTVSVPIGLQFGPNPGSIEVHGTGHKIDYDGNFYREDPRGKIDTTGSTGLQVQPGNTLALVGGNISLEGGILTSPAGRIEIGSFGSNQLVGIDVKQGLKLGYEGATNFGDIKLSGKALVNTTGDGGGTIAIAGRNINLSGESILLADTLGNQNGGEISIFGDSIVLNRSSLGSDSFSSGNTGQIKLDAKNINFENKSTAGIQTSDTGDAENINIHANSLSIETSKLFSVTTEKSTGRAGDINFNVADLVIKKTQLVTNTYGRGEAGNINISADSFLLEGGSVLASVAKANSTGRAGDINIKVNGLLRINGGSITTDTYGTGDAGKINISANSFQMESGNVASQTWQESKGNAGEININVAGPFTINNTQVTNNTYGTGNAGTIKISANSFKLEHAGVLSNTGTSLDDMTLEPNNRGISTNTGSAGEINIHVAGALELPESVGITTTTYSKGDAGKITISANSFLLENSAVQSNTEEGSIGKAGEINIHVAGLFKINSAGAESISKGSGNAGNLNVRASTLVLDNQGGLRVNSSGNSDAGNLTIVADTIKLDHQSGIFATTNSGNGGDLTLNVAKLLLLDNSSLISASAGNNNSGGKGGNIIINAPNGLIVGVPDKNNDITANAYTGTGGNITITTRGIFGIVQRKSTPQNTTNDIDASSQFNKSGTVTINTVDVDPSRGLVKLPTVVINPPRLTNSNCNAFDTGGSSFTVTGRGGLPPSPDEPLTNDVVWTDTRIPVTTSQQHTSNKPKAKPKAEPIVIAPAIGWVFHDNGDVTLISSTHGANHLATTPAHCSEQR